MRYTTIDPILFIRNRGKIVQSIQPNSLAIWHSNEVYPTNTDGAMPFIQQSDLFYLTGIDQEDAILLICPDAPKSEWKEILFIKRVDQHTTIWDGPKYTQQEAQTISGIDTVYWLDQFEKILHTLISSVEYIYCNSNEHPRSNAYLTTKDHQFITWIQQRYPLHGYKRLAPIMSNLRMCKEPEEIELIRHACAITAKGFQAAFKTIMPGIKEYEIEAQFAYEFVRNGANYFAYEPIIASGANSCILHYNANHKTCQDGDILLMDVGSTYANYASDVTRTVPVNGKFNKRQRQVYEAVLNVLKCVQNLIKPNLSFAEYNQAVVSIVEKELVDLKLISINEIKDAPKDNPAYRRYFMHGISHHLGLSTHDLGDTYGKILPNMVLTVEPGIYIFEEDLGIRLENTIAVTERGIRNLTEDIPIEPDEIQNLMSKA